MPSLPTKTLKPPGISIWLFVTLLWGTVFYWTSIVMFRYASAILGVDSVVTLSSNELWQAYGIHVVVLVMFALLAMVIRRAIDPSNSKQIERYRNIEAGKGERIFISFAGSIATSFFFTLLTALTLSISAAKLGFAVTLTMPVVLLAALLNISAGLGASLFVGIIFLAAKIGAKKA